MVPPRAACAAYILAGGASRRMGRDKAGLELHGRSLLQHIARRVAPSVAQVYVVVKESAGTLPAAAGLSVLLEPTPGRALVHGIRTVLAAPGPAWRYILACDMPDVGADALALLWNAAQVAAAPGACVRSPHGIEPLPSLWHASLAAAPHDGWGMSARGWVSAAGLAVVEPAAKPAWLVNVNTPSEWGEYCSTQP
jgi:molybdopterin-guanine dinucleotide biosynthesis protein A